MLWFKNLPYWVHDFQNKPYTQKSMTEYYHYFSPRQHMLPLTAYIPSPAEPTPHCSLQLADDRPPLATDKYTRRTKNIFKLSHQVIPNALTSVW